MLYIVCYRSLSCIMINRKKLVFYRIFSFIILHFLSYKNDIVFNKMVKYKYTKNTGGTK